MPRKRHKPAEIVAKLRRRTCCRVDHSMIGPPYRPPSISKPRLFPSGNTWIVFRCLPRAAPYDFRLPRQPEQFVGRGLDCVHLPARKSAAAPS
jgi:hypothetical protein